MLLMLEKGIRGGICHCIDRYVKANSKYMKHYYRNKESSYLKYLDINNLYGLAMSQKLPVNDFSWIEDISEFGKCFIKSCNDESDQGYFLEIDVQNYKTFTIIYHYYLKELKLKKLKRLLIIYLIKLNMLFT